MNIFYTICRALLWLPAKIIFPTKVFNKKALPKGRKMIVVANHLSWKDIVLISINIPKYRHVLGKKELGKNPFVRFFAFLLGTILIDRNKADISAMRTVINKLNKNRGLLIFPEGTRNKVNDEIQDIKHGVAMFASKSDSQIVPIMIHHKAKAFKKSYLYVGEPFKIETSGAKILSSAAMAAGADLVGEKMKEAQAKLKSIVAEHIEQKSKKRKKQVDENEKLVNVRESMHENNNSEA